jgi:hypothetical protein
MGNSPSAGKGTHPAKTNNTSNTAENPKPDPDHPSDHVVVMVRDRCGSEVGVDE